MRKLLAVVAVLLAGLAVPAHATSTPSCVLMLGSYPAEVRADLSQEVLDAHQPTALSGHDFYVGRLGGHRVVIGIAGPSTALARSTTLLALKHFPCANAVVFTGTAGGGPTIGLGDVAVPSRWTGDEGKTYRVVEARALKVARATAKHAKLEDLAAVEDGPCTCSGVLAAVDLVPILRTPVVAVGGNGVSFGGEADTCSAQGGQLEGCNPCPPTATTPPVVRRDLTPLQASRAMDVAPHRPSLQHASRPDATFGNSATSYVADDQQTESSMAAAVARHVPFIAFRGISDTASVGDLWPAEYAVYQGLAADNAEAAARAWLDGWA